ncbi:MAG: helix-turn-helix domain-containing protein [Desulfuromonadaceae bacterium]|nr:helix-turn-helix domain-containing protein [Desulfuromonadaceae bacterium]MDD2856908.1 helix-turn-helix domain-containing protein [Desulfuromonadaceae bacterium]
MMKPNKIKALLVENGITQTSIARELGISTTTVAKTIVGGFVSRRTRMLIAEKAQVPFEKMWGQAA